MANLEISRVCSLRCPYCFAAEHMQQARDARVPAFLALEAFEQRLDFLDRSGMDQVRLIGGEPTLHPQFGALVARARQRGKAILVFSHGLMPESALAVLEGLPPEVCTVMVNMNATRNAQVTAQEHAWRVETVQRLGPRALLGYTIYSADFDLAVLLPVIEAAGCQRVIRVGLAQPDLAGRNQALNPKRYPWIGERLAAFATVAAQAGVRLDFDCGFVRCMFSDTDLERLRAAGADVAWRCSPIVDIAIDGQALHCFPLSGRIVQPLDGTLADLRAGLTQQLWLYREAGIYPECSSCPFKQSGECSGGGMEQTLRRFQRGTARLRVPDAPLYREDQPTP